MRIEPFLQVIDELDDKYVTEAIRYRKKSRTKLMKWLTIAACVCLFLGVGIDTLQRYEFFLASCGANIVEEKPTPIDDDDDDDEDDFGYGEDYENSF